MHCLLYKCYSHLSPSKYTSTNLMLYISNSLPAVFPLSFWVASFPGISTVQFMISSIVCKNWRGRPGSFYHVNGVGVYLGRQSGRKGSPIEGTHLAYFASPMFKTPAFGTETARKDLKLIFVNREPFPPSVDTDIIQVMKWTRPYLDSGKA